MSDFMLDYVFMHTLLDDRTKSAHNAQDVTLVLLLPSVLGQTRRVIQTRQRTKQLQQGARVLRETEIHV